MLDEITTIRRRFTRHSTLDECIDEAFVALSGLGYDALVYDYTPIPYDLDGAIMIPSMLKLRNIDDDMRDYWCDRGYFRIDPVQIVAARSSTPFPLELRQGDRHRDRRAPRRDHGTRGALSARARPH